MRYYIIAGEASGDLHASHLMQDIKEKDQEAQFRFFGGDCMAAVGGTLVKHYREMAYMGFIPVLLHLRTILRNMKMCKEDIRQWQPDRVILVDYAGFNMKIAEFVKKEKICPVVYYIAPKIWAWKEHRIKSIKRYVDCMLSILPFEKEFFEGKHHYPIHYVGNPTANEVREWLETHERTVPEKPVIALLAGSRRQEIEANLPAMLEATARLTDYDIVVAGAPGIEPDFYAPLIEGKGVRIVHGETYRLLSQATVALVTSGTATLETCMFRVPQVVCYKTAVPRLARWGFDHILKVRFISLVNLIADREVVAELFADRFSVTNIRHELLRLLPGGEGREQMLHDYDEVHRRLEEGENAALCIIHSS